MLGIHPETARRIDLDRLDNFVLERIPASDGIYCFYGRSRAAPADERIFVLADARSRSPEDGREAALHLPAFEHAFYEATRALRTILGERDPERRLQWNRIALFVAPAIYLNPDVAQRLARRLAPATRHLGIEKVVVRLSLLDRAAPELPARAVEFVISDLTGSGMEIRQREPRTERLEPSSAYERKVVEARRRGLVYPYEIIRMLTGSRDGPGAIASSALPAGAFEEYDLEPGAARPTARSVAGRAYGSNTSSVVFGVIRTPTAEGARGHDARADALRPDARHGLARGARVRSAGGGARSRGEAAGALRVDPGLERRAHRDGQRHREPRCDRARRAPHRRVHAGRAARST